MRATAVRVGMRALLIPEGQALPDGAVMYGEAGAEQVYETFFADDYCRRGHPRRLMPWGAFVCVYGTGNCMQAAELQDVWSLWDEIGAPGEAKPLVLDLEVAGE